MKNVPTINEREEMRRPSVENFQRLWDSLISYNDVHITMMFYPKRRETRPKALFFPRASPKDVYDYFIHGLIDSLYFHGSNPRELQEFPPKVQNAIKVYNDHFAKGRELYLKREEEKGEGRDEREWGGREVDEMREEESGRGERAERDGETERGIAEGWSKVTNTSIWLGSHLVPGFIGWAMWDES
ncbi:hypothetical protein Tco_0619379 [Tanacetum coccineum]